MTTLLITISCYIIWICYFLIEGYREAYYFNSIVLQFYVQDSQKKNLHPIFTVQRFLVALIINIACFSLGWKLILFDLALIAAQPFFHNGMYYLIRNKLNPKTYPKKWFDESTTTTDKSTKYETPTERVIYLILSILSIIFITTLILI